MQLKRTILIALLTSATVAAWSQAQFGQVQGYLGTTLFPKTGQDELLAGFKPGITVGGGVSKTILHSLVFNPNVELTASSKEHYNFSLLSLHNNLKYYPFLLTTLRPYVMAIGNISFMNLHQQAFETTVTPDLAYSVSDPTHIPVDQIIYREPDLKLSFAPTVGVGAGIGVDIPIRLKVVPFIQYSFTQYFTKSSNLINDNFKNNTKNLSTQIIAVGIRYNMYQDIKK